MNLNYEQKEATIEALSLALAGTNSQINCLNYQIKERDIALQDMQTIKSHEIALERKAVACLLEDNATLREQISNLETANKILSVCIEGSIKDIKQMNEDNQNLKCFIGLMRAEIKPQTGGINGI